MDKRENFAGVTKLFANPAYTGIRVHPDLIAERPRDYDQALFMHIAHAKAREIGGQQCLRDFLKGLKEPDTWTLLIPIHPSLAGERTVHFSEEEFIVGAAALMGRMKVEAYFTLVTDNLAQGVLGYGPEGGGNG
jgi:hypothetical protein